MSMHTLREAKSADGTTIGRGWSNKLWQNCPWTALRDNPQLGYAYFEDFLGFDAGSWTTTNATSGTLAPTAGAYGIATLDAGATTDAQGVIDTNPGDSVGGWITPSASTTIWFETLVRPTNVANAFWAGLATHGEGLTSAGAPTGTNRIGFLVENASALLFNYKDAGDSEYEIDTTDDFVTAIWIKLGFYMEGLTRVTPYINGAVPATPGIVIAANEGKDLPDAVMNLCYACVANGTTQPTLDVDWVRIAVLDEPTNIVTL